MGIAFNIWEYNYAFILIISFIMLLISCLLKCISFTYALMKHAVMTFYLNIYLNPLRLNLPTVIEIGNFVISFQHDFLGFIKYKLGQK